jgi:hypothetical protein
MAQEAGFTPQAVPPKILFPLLEGASLEDNEDLHDMWAALLANAAFSENADIVRPGFIATLRQMAPDEAALLLRIADGHFGDQLTDDSTLMQVYDALGLGPEEYRGNPSKQIESSMSFVHRLRACRDGLLAEQLIKRTDDPPEDRLYGLSSRGVEFLKACRPPKRKE